MANLKIGVLLDSLRMGVKKGMEAAARIGVRGFQVSATHGELAPENLTRTGRRDFLSKVRSYNLEISALLADFGKGFTDPALVDELVERTRRIVDLSVDLGVPILTTHIGVIPDDPSSPKWHTMAESLKAIGDYAAKYDRVLAAETGPESPALMKKFLDELRCDGLKVNYDPANLVMKGFDPVQGVRELGDRIVHTHAKDAVRDAIAGRGREVPLGQGAVPFPEYLAAMAEIGYNGYYTIERETGEDPVADIVAAKKFLESI